MRTHQLLLLPLVILVVLLSGCVTPTPTLTPLELQALQSREFESTKEVVFPSIVSVFQDLGYTITNADLPTGLIAAERTSQNNAGIGGWLLGVSRVQQTKVTAFIERIGTKTRARLNFIEVVKTSFDHGQTDRHDRPLLNAKVYENAFDRIENAIFVRTNQ